MLFLLVGLCSLSVVSCQILGLQEGEECTPLRGGDGVCKVLQECKEIGDFKKDHPPICTFKNKVPVICCPNNLGTRTKVGTKADQYCSKFVESRCDGASRAASSLPGVLRRPPVRINVVGGRLTKPRDHKNMVLIGYGSQNDISWSCGGSLISARFVLSAAHCVSPFSGGPARWAKMGDLDLSSSSDDAKPVTKRIVERITYPDYVASQNYHDIALFKLDSDVVFNPWVMPVCLHTKREITDRTATVTGWGRTDFAEGTSEKLLEADLNIYNETECARLMFSNKDPKTPKGYQADLMFCAGVPDGSKDACLGDSGGPLVIRKVGNCVKTQIGVTSYGKQCALPDSPGVYTRVSHYIAWIEKIVFNEGIF